MVVIDNWIVVDGDMIMIDDNFIFIVWVNGLVLIDLLVVCVDGDSRWIYMLNSIVVNEMVMFDVNVGEYVLEVFV